LQKNKQAMRIQFLGAAREVTGSKHLLTTDNGRRILLDCGVYQGKGMDTEELNRKLNFNPKEIDNIILTHAHIDHSGLIPYIYKLGFRGSVVCTNATRDLCAYMLADSGHIHEQDTRTYNKKLQRLGKKPIEPIYTKQDAIDCMELFIGVPYDRKFYIDDKTRVRFTNTGHLLGSAVANIEILEGGHTKRLAYTGDIGRPENRIIKAPSPFISADYIICESTYGNRRHDNSLKADEDLLSIVHETCVTKGGKLIIPSFSVGRTQEIVYSLNNFYNEKKLPKVDIFVDSPLAMNVTNVFRLHADCFNKKILQVMENDSDPFGFNSLHYVKSIEESKQLNDYSKPCVIISASGMAEAGRVKHHLANNISNPKNTVLMVGYCAPSTLGARLLRGDKNISIHGNPYEVKAQISRLESYSGHADYLEITSFLSCQDKKRLEKMFLVHGDYDAQTEMKTYLESQGFENIVIPEKGSSYSM
jgi:metallo-beta-lactamase family protein